MVAYSQIKLASAAAVACCTFLLAAGAGAAQHSFPCNNGYTGLSQRVLDQSTHVPLVNARVTATWNDGTDRQVASVTDSAGRALLCVPLSRALRIRSTYAELNSSWQTTLTQPNPSAQTVYIDVPGSLVRGRVIDQQTGLPIAQASVRIPNTSLLAMSNVDGRFVFERMPLGKYALKIEHISYASNQALLDVAHEDLDALIHLAPAAIALQPVIVTAFSRRLENVGFYERQQRGVGTFIDRKKIDAMNVKNASELLRRAPGVRLVPQSRTRANQPDNATIGNRGNCRYVFVIDGSRTLPDFEMDHVAAGAIEGVEVYNGVAEVPALLRAIAGHTMCGVIAIWTRNSR